MSNVTMWDSSEAGHRPGDSADPPPPADVGPSGGADDGGMRSVAEFRHAWEAELARGALDQAGIRAVVDSSNLSDPYPSLAAVGSGVARVLVAGRHYHDARRLLEHIAGHGH